jgi:hypothetical protein
MVKYKIRLDTLSDVTKFVKITSAINSKVTVTDNQGLKVSGKSILGMMYAMEFDELWCESDIDIYNAIEKFLVLES